MTATEQQWETHRAKLNCYGEQAWTCDDGTGKCHIHDKPMDDYQCVLCGWDNFPEGPCNFHCQHICHSCDEEINDRYDG